VELRGKVCVVKGGASGIGRALCRRFAAEGAARVAVADRNAEGAAAVAGEIDGLAVTTDVGVEADVQALVDATTARWGRIDLFCSNAGIAIDGGESASNGDWQRILQINVMAHVYAARAVIPPMLERGDGYVLSTASAAGLLSQVGSAPYTVTKHAALAFAEWLSITYGDRGLKVSCLCPQGVRTGMLNEDSGPAFLLTGALAPEQVAEVVVAGLRDERFLILPHPEVAEYVRRKADDPERWLRGMRRLQARIFAALGR
jgi:NAD(P)-dependent dehydrogenase (short-subunit alcohol dehydrogenase family)